MNRKPKKTRGSSNTGKRTSDNFKKPTEPQPNILSKRGAVSDSKSGKLLSSRRSEPGLEAEKEPRFISYKGKITTSGTSDAIRIDKTLFKQHPEFKQHAEVEAHIIGPGKMLISVQSENIDNECDPILDAFLSFIEKDMANNAAAITALEERVIDRARQITADVTFCEQDFE